MKTHFLNPIAMLVLLMSMTCIAQPAFAQEKFYKARRLKGETPVIDGHFNENLWQTTPWESQFTQREPNEGAAPSQKTAFKILYTDQYLFVAIKAYDTHPDLIDSRISRRDNMTGDFAGIEIDSYNDKRTAFSFAVNAAGVKTDRIIYNDGGNRDADWDPIWIAETSINSEGWNAEIKIPLNQLRFGKAATQTWGLQVGRFIFRKEESVFWKHIPLEQSGYVSQFGILSGLKGIDPARQVELSPYAVTKLKRFKPNKDNPFIADDGKAWVNNAGMNGKIGLTNDFTLDFAINPDFGQVEADPSQVNLSAYESYFQEKRPFFIEGNNITDFSLTDGGNPFAADNLFYSRRIGRSPQYSPQLDDGAYARAPSNTSILGAMKLTGKTRNGLSVGLINSVTAEEKVKIANGDERYSEVAEPLTNYLIGSAEKDFNKGETVLGGMFTSTNRQINHQHLKILPENAYSGGINFSHKWNDRKYTFSGKLSMSHITGSTEAITSRQESPRRYFNRPDASHLTLDTTRTSLTGHGGSLSFSRNGSSKFRCMAFVTWRSPGLELNDAGYLRQSDAIMQVFWAGYRITEPFSIFRSMSFNINQWTGWNFGGNLLYKGGNINAGMQFKNYWSFNMGINRNMSGTSTSVLRGGPALSTPGHWNMWYYLNSDSRKKFRISAHYSSHQADHDYSSRQSVGLDLIYRPLDALEISFMPDFSKSQNELQYITTQELSNENHYIMGKIDRITTDLTLRIDLAITPEMSLQYYGSPYISSGKYSRFKKIVAPRASDYHDRFALLEKGSQISYADDEYLVDDDGDGASEYSISDPDFNFKQFRSNFVFRWEYTPGSLLYLVWSQGRTGYDNYGNFDFNRDMNQLFNVFPENVFLMKLSYMLPL